MVNITHKPSTLREAIATAVIQVSSQATIDAVINNKVPKGDITQFSRAAGLLAIKKTSDVIPDCHPLPVEYASITHEIRELEIVITVEVHTIYKTGVEVEAMHGAAVAALTIYDMLKPIDKHVEIGNIKLLSKKGGKSDPTNKSIRSLKTAVVVCSDSISAGASEDLSGNIIINKLAGYGIPVSRYEIIPDDMESIRDLALELSATGYQLIMFTGGTGLSPKDLTPDAIAPLFTRAIPGISEVMRSYGQQRTPYAMLSRSVAGFIGDTLVISMPGASTAAAECMDAVFPQVLHVFEVAGGSRHND